MCGNLLQLKSIGFNKNADQERVVQQTFILDNKRYAYHDNYKVTPRQIIFISLF